MSGEKTEKPTAKRLKEARKEGQVARTPDLGAWLAMLAATFLVPRAAQSVMDVLVALMMGVSAAIVDPDPDRALALLGKGLSGAAMAMLPLVAGIMVIGIAAAAAQGGIHPATKKLKPSFKPLNLVQGVKRLVGVMTWWEAGKILIKTALLAAVLWGVVAAITPKLTGAVNAPLASTLGVTASGVLNLVRAAVLVGLVMAIGDYMVKRRHINKQIKMSKHDIQQEHKQSEGDPHIKGHRRALAFAMSRNRMMADLASADVVLVNPTHVAVALRYVPGTGAPVVVAKGSGAVAAAIRERATQERVPLVQDVPLARALHAACEIGQEIPADLYSAVAHVLAFVMGLRKRGAAAGSHVMPAGVRPGVPSSV
ncbi:EscU/YscU/HrcU family type III secretion system export apparatus switch protein [Angustibacter luteus]|uniref:Flagellar biosynthesis protein FlhB n=1 Tax=Angustibacter luteus TaxID=658456 RepID=A0ABW1JGS3_9ACTN